MRRTLSLLALLASAALAGCPSKPPMASLIEIDGSVRPIDGSVDAPVAPPVDAPDGAPDSMPPDANNVIELGFPDPLPGTRTMDNTAMIGFPIHVAASQAGELAGWGVTSASAPAGTQVRMALYSNAGTMNQPATLLTQSGAWNLPAGALPTSGYLLNAGDYWLLISVSATVSIGTTTVSPPGSTECFRALMFMTVFPNTWDSGSCLAANPINIFIRIRPSI
jgi:hypothetical protein